MITEERLKLWERNKEKKIFLSEDYGIVPAVPLSEIIDEIRHLQTQLAEAKEREQRIFNEFGIESDESTYEIVSRMNHALIEFGAENTKLREEVGAAEKLCRLYFDIASGVLGEDEVRRLRDRNIAIAAGSTLLDDKKGEGG